MLPTPDDLRRYLLLGMNCDHHEVEGDGQHFTAVIVSSQFEGLRPVARHQVVYRALGDRMRQEIHALSMKTPTPDEWSARG